MNKENSQDDGVQSSQNQSDIEIKDDNSQPSADAVVEMDDQVKEVLGSHLESSDDSSEDQKEVTDDDKTEGEIQENKDSKNNESLNGDEKNSEVQSGNVEETEPKRLDRRIAKLYAKNKLLSGDESDVDIEALAREIQKYPVRDKVEALNKLLSRNKELTTGNNDGVVEYSDEDSESIIEAEVDNRLNQMQSEISDKERQDDLVKTLEAHPELDQDSKEFNKPLHDAVYGMYLKGMKVSEAYKLLVDSIDSVKGKIVENEKNRKEIAKQNAFSGAVSTSSDEVKDDGIMTWEKLGEIERNDPERFLKIVQSGNLPER